MSACVRECVSALSCVCVCVCVCVCIYICVNDRLVGLGETDVSGISDSQILYLFADFPPPVLIVGRQKQKF